MTKKNESKKELLSQDINLTHPSNTEAEIAGEIPAKEMERFKHQALTSLAQDLELDGFRKGQVPAELAQKHLGEQTILYQAAELALQEEYPRLISHFQLEPLGAPRISITKIAGGSPLGFKINTALMPEIELPDYKQIAIEKNTEYDPREAEIAVEDQEVEQMIETLEKQLGQQQSNSTETEESGAILGADGAPLTGSPAFKLTDETVGQLGDFQSIQDLKNKLKDNLKREKQAEAIEKHRLSILETVIEQAKISLPDLILEEELGRMINQLKQDIEKAGLSFEQYLEQMKKTESELKTEWRPQAEKRAKLQLILNKIAETENLEPDQAILEEQSRVLAEHHPQADPQQIKTYVTSQLKNEAVFKILEEQRPAPDLKATTDQSKTDKTNQE